MRYLSAMDSTISAVFTIRSILRVACYFLSSLGSMSNLTPSRIFLRMNKSSLSLILTSISNKYMEPSKQRKCQISTLLPTWKGLRLSTTISTTTSTPSRPAQEPKKWRTNIIRSENGFYAKNKMKYISSTSKIVICARDGWSARRRKLWWRAATSSSIRMTFKFTWCWKEQKI